MLESNVHIALGVAVVGLVVVFLGSAQLLRSRWGRWILLGGGALLPIVASAGTFKEGLEESSRTRFCLSCHEMTDYGKSLFVDNRQSLPAAHFQERRVDRENACFACHTDYALFGDVKAKLNGLKHVYVHYLGELPAKMALYQPYPNYNCLHCHDDARRFLEAPAHQGLKEQMASGALSCLECHAVGHDMGAVKDRRFWQAR